MAHLIAILHIHHPTVHSPPVHVDNRPQLALTCEHVATKGITLFTLIHDPINGKPDIIVLYQARDNDQISAHAQHAGCFFRLYW